MEVALETCGKANWPWWHGPSFPPLVTDWATDVDVVASLQEACVVGAGTISVGSSMTCAQSGGCAERANVVYWKTNGKINNDLQCCAEVNATFRTRTGLQYPAWKVIQDFAKCSCHLKVPTTRKSERSIMNSFAGNSSEWIGLCPAFVHLPRFLV